MEDLREYKNRNGFVCAFPKTEKTIEEISKWQEDISISIIKNGWSETKPERILNKASDTNIFFFFIWAENHSLKSGEIYSFIKNSFPCQTGMFFFDTLGGFLS